MVTAVGLMAYNEEANVASALRSVLAQRGAHVRLHSVTVVASGCTDATVPRAREAAGDDPRVRVLEQARREGKAAAITAFLATVRDADLVALVGADTRLADGTLEALLSPFASPEVGMTGGRPVPVNARTRLLGRVVHLLWELHHEVAVLDPKLGELVAFRPVFDAVPADTAVDEAAIEALVRARGLRLAYAPAAVVHMKGPTTVGDFLAQRRRIHAGHLRLRRTSGHAVSTLGLPGVVRAVLRRRPRFSTLTAAAALEGTARLLGSFDARVAGREHRVWKAIPSTKDLTP
jgi:cellulose synthase/poly-beta-1,6-N-acetylglucosamine synthase-like glycosyltransferase